MLTIPATFDGRRTVPSEAVTRVMLDLLDLHSEDIVLEIGTGSGFQTGVFAGFGCTVHSIECEPWIDTTQAFGECVFLYPGNGALGLPSHAPFTAIVATCGVEQIQKPWEEQLALGGRLVVPIGDPKSQRLTLFRKDRYGLVPQRIGAYVRFQMLREKPQPKLVKPVYKQNPDAE